MNRDFYVRRASLGDAAVVAQLLSELNLTVGAGGYPDAVARLPEAVPMRARAGEVAEMAAAPRQA